MSAPIPSLTLVFYTREETARILKISLRSMDTLIAENKIAVSKLGRHSLRFTPQAIVDCILSLTVRARVDGAGPERLAQEDAELLWQRIEGLVERSLEGLVRRSLESRIKGRKPGPSRTGRLADMEAAA